MCGICGKLMFEHDAGVSPSLLRAMTDTLNHRGPDDDGYYVSGPVGLGFRRLSIIDLGGGHQPLSNEDGTVWIVFNGEIYNYRELRSILISKGHVFKTQSDTEVIVHLYEEFGEGCAEKLRGMFAFAIWDDRRQVLFLARDRVGIKPLYYYLTDNSLIFGSEMKAILADPEVNRESAPGMVDRFLSFNFVPGEDTLLKNVQKLAAGTHMVVSARTGRSEIRQYWDLRFEPAAADLRESEAKLSELLADVMQLHMISDVPVGFLLSGGFDSTALLSIATEMTEHPISSFTVGFAGSAVPDERPYARLAARTFGTTHHEITISAGEFESFLPQYVWHMEEPVCEPPAIAMYYVSKLARESVKVLISGEGGDEAFAGYPNYRNLLWLERLKTALGPAKRPVASGLLAANRLLKSAKIAKYAPLLTLPLESYYYSKASSPFRFFNQHGFDLYTSEFAHAVNKEHSLSPVTKYLAVNTGRDKLNKMLYVDTKTWLVDDLLLKADKMTMANSVELRVPFLDHKLLEFAASLPSNYKVHGFETKYIAKRALKRRVPREIAQRKKAGFPVPYESWLRVELKGWLQGILLDRETLGRGYFKKASLERLIADDCERGGYSKELFSLAVLELWHRAFLDCQVPQELGV